MGKEASHLSQNSPLANCAARFSTTARSTAVDIDRVKVKALGQEMNHYFLMRRPWKGKVPAGHAEPRWKIEFKWMSITIFTMVVTWEDLERLR